MIKSHNYTQYKLCRDEIISIQKNPLTASNFRFPALKNFNWVNDWFDHIKGKEKIALKIITEKYYEEYSFEKLQQRSKQLALWLINIGVQQQDRIFICLENRVELFELLLATQRIGAIAIPSFPDFPYTETRKRLQESKSKFLISTAAQLENIDTKLLIKICVDDNCSLNNILYLQDAWQYKSNKTLERIVNKSDDPCFAYFTSGTTSRPKIVIHSYESYAIGHLSSLCWNGVRPGDSHFNISPPGWAKHTWSSFFVPWAAEATNVVTSIKNITAKQLLDIIVQHRINTFCAPPTIWKKIALNHINPVETQLREIVSAGEPLDSNTIDSVFSVLKIPLRNGYGQSESTAIFGQYPNEYPKKTSVGKVLPGYKVFLDTELDASDERSVGEICIDLEHSSIPLMLGYDQKNPLNIKTKHYRTGDIAYQDNDNHFFILGRNDHVFKTNDFRVSPYEFEEIINQMDLICKSAVIPKPNKNSGFLPLAFIVLADQIQQKKTNLAKEIFDYVNSKLPSAYSLSYIVFCDELPETYTNKINRGLIIQEKFLNNKTIHCYKTV